jgi:hypothetical protein
VFKEELMTMLAINLEGVGYLLATFLVPFLLVWIFSKKWYYGLLAGVIWTAFQLSRQKPASPPRPVQGLLEASPTP